jgi:hypothetical protein
MSQFDTSSAHVCSRTSNPISEKNKLKYVISSRMMLAQGQLRWPDGSDENG